MSYGSAAVAVRQSYVTSGPITFNADAAFTAYPAIEIDVPAVVGDWVEFCAGGMWQPISTEFIDWAVVVGSTMVRFSSTGGASPAVQGDPGWYPGAGYMRSPGVFAFAVTAGDLDGGNVRFTIAHQGGSGGVLYCNANFPLRLNAKNFHAVA